MGAGLLHQSPNLEDQVIFDQGFLPLALDTPVSNCKSAVLVLVRPGYFISLVPPPPWGTGEIKYPGLTSGDGFHVITSNIHAKRIASKLCEMHGSMLSVERNSLENMWKVLSTGFLSVVSVQT